MNIKKIKAFFISAIWLSGLLSANQTLAVCPVCIIAVAGGVELSRWLGVDDTISGVWLGGLIVSVSLWFLNWLRKKKINFILMREIVFILFYAVVILPFYWMKIIGFPNCQKLWGYDKLLVGIVFGSLAFAAGHGLSVFLKKINNNKAYFPFQKVILPIVFLIILSIIFYYITKCEV